MNDFEKFVSMLKHAGYVEGQDYEIILRDEQQIIHFIDDNEEVLFEPYFTFIAPDWHFRDWYY